MSASRQLTPKQQAILDIFHNHNALISIVFDSEYRYRPNTIGYYDLDYTRINQEYLDQIIDPTKNRPSRAVDFFGASWIPQFDFPLISLEADKPLSEEAAQQAQDKNQPIFIMRDNATFSVYGFNYYREVKWQEAPLTDLDENQKQLLQKFSFDGTIIKKEDGFPTSSNIDVQQLYALVRRLHSYLPTVINKMNLKTLQVHQHKPGQNRYTKHKDQEFTHTAKTATSLCPPDPRYMELYSCDEGIGFLWDINDCNLKEEKYIFERNAITDDCFWLDLNAGYEYDYHTRQINYVTAEEKIANVKERMRALPATTLAALREKNLAAIKNQKPIYWSELQVGLPKGILRSVFATQDIPSVRLRALRGMLHAKEKLKLQEDLPLFILQPFYGKEDPDDDPKTQRQAVFRFYSTEEQAEDIAAEAADLQAAQAALDVIKNQCALALTVSDKNMVDRYFEQTEKVDTALLPSEPQWMKFSDDDGVIGLLWDITTCDIDSTARATIDTLKEKNNHAVNQKQMIDRNTLPVKLPHDQIKGIFYSGPNVIASAKAQEIAAYIKEKLKLTVNIPLFLIQPGRSCDLYSELNQLMDRIQAKHQYSSANTSAQQSHARHFRANKNARLGLFSPSSNATPTSQEESDWVKVNKADCVEHRDKNRCSIM